MGLEPLWMTPNGLFVVSIEGRDRYINLAHSTLNSHASTSLAKNKYLTRLILERNGMQNIPFSRPQTHAEAEAFLHKHARIIAKPLCGSGARDVHLITHVRQLQDLEITGYILEKYIAGKELRYLVLNGTVIGVHESDYGVSVEETRPLRRISYRRANWDQSLIASSVKIANILNLRFTAVDYLIDPSGHAYILEVNTTPGLKWFHAPTTGPVVDVARLFLEALFKDQRVSA